MATPNDPQPYINYGAQVAASLCLAIVSRDLSQGARCVPAAAVNTSSTNGPAARQAADGHIVSAAAATKRLASSADALTRVVSPTPEGVKTEAEQVLKVLKAVDVMKVVKEVIPAVGVLGRRGIDGISGHAPEGEAEDGEDRSSTHIG